MKETGQTRSETQAIPSGWVAGIHSLYLYGALGVASFGWAFCHKLGINHLSTFLLWFAGAILVYNTDRLKPDPSDPLIKPLRVASSGRFQRTSLGLILGAALVLLLTPILLGEWMLLFLVIAGSLICLGYSVQLFGLRFRDVPVLKTFFVPTLISAAYLVVPLSRAELPIPPSRLLFGLAWAWCILFFNTLICDLRDLEGDRAAGTVSLPVFLGPAATRRLILGVGAAIPLLALLLSWPWQALASLFYLGGLIVALRKPRSEAFYEWWVEGLLFLPALVESARALAGFLVAGS